MQMNKFSPVLRIQELSKVFSGLHALSDIDLYVNPSDILGVIGPNGAGKTTLINLITCFTHPTKGQIFFLWHNITYAKPDFIALIWIWRTFQNIRLFGMMSVIDNIRVALQLHNSTNPFSVLLNLPNFLNCEQESEEQAMILLKFFRIDNYCNLPASSLSYGVQRRLEMARAIALHPQLLLLDEPTAGMDPVESQEMLELIKTMHDQYSLAIILIAHDMKLVMNLCPRIQVLNEGKTIALGTPSEVRAIPQVIEAYMGSE